MMKLIKSTDSKLLLVFTLFFSFTALAKNIVRVTDVKGNAFIFTPSGKTYTVKKGMSVKDLSEIMVEDGGQVSVTNFHEHQFHIGGGSHVKFLNKITELKNGYLWVQSNNSNVELSVHTANGIVDYDRADYVLTYDGIAGSTQVVVLNGGVTFANSIETHLKYDVPAGKFSLIDSSYQNGVPRQPTPVGFKSFKSVVGYFENISPLDRGLTSVMKSKAVVAERSVQKPRRTRKIASVNTYSASEDPLAGLNDTNNSKPQNSYKKYNSGKRGKVLFVKSYQSNLGRVPASSAPNASSYYQAKKDAERRWRNRPKFVKMRVFKVPETEKSKTVVQKRLPASVASDSDRLIDDIEREFNGSMIKSFKSQERHPASVNKLIKELKSVDDNFDTDY